MKDQLIMAFDIVNKINAKIEEQFDEWEDCYFFKPSIEYDDNEISISFLGIEIWNNKSNPVFSYEEDFDNYIRNKMRSLIIIISDINYL